MCVCRYRQNETEIKREEQAREQLHSDEDFCSADDYTCQADATPAAGTLAAKVSKPGWHRKTLKGTGCVCECVFVCAGVFLCVR